MLKCPDKGASHCIANCHAELGVRHDALGLQHDVARVPRVQIPQKEGKTSAPRRIGSPPCRVGSPTRRGPIPKAAKQPKRGQNERATSYCAPAMTRWASNTTWLHPKGTKSPQKRAKRAHYVALGFRHDALGLQHDVAPSQRGQNERATSYCAPAMSRWTSNATWLPNFRLHHTETGTDKRWRSHFGSKRGGLYGVVGSVELVGVAGCGPIAGFPYSWKLPSGSAVGHDLTRPTHRCYANRRLPYLPQTRNAGRRPYTDCRSCPAANNVGSQYRLAEFGAQWKSIGAADRGWHAGAAPVNPRLAAGADYKADLPSGRPAPEAMPAPAAIAYTDPNLTPRPANGPG